MNGIPVAYTLALESQKIRSLTSNVKQHCQFKESAEDQHFIYCLPLPQLEAASFVVKRGFGPLVLDTVSLSGGSKLLLTTAATCSCGGGGAFLYRQTNIKTLCDANMAKVKIIPARSTSTMNCF